MRVKYTAILSKFPKHLPFADFDDINTYDRMCVACGDVLIDPTIDEKLQHLEVWHDLREKGV
jgi:hypothetical protein